MDFHKRFQPWPGLGHPGVAAHTPTAALQYPQQPHAFPPPLNQNPPTSTDMAMLHDYHPIKNYMRDLYSYRHPSRINSTPSGSTFLPDAPLEKPEAQYTELAHAPTGEFIPRHETTFEASDDTEDITITRHERNLGDSALASTQQNSPAGNSQETTSREKPDVVVSDKVVRECLVCGKDFRVRARFVNHLMRAACGAWYNAAAHKGAAQSLVCKVCDKHFDNREGLYNHVHVHTPSDYIAHMGRDAETSTSSEDPRSAERPDSPPSVPKDIVHINLDTDTDTNGCDSPLAVGIPEPLAGPGSAMIEERQIVLVRSYLDECHDTNDISCVGTTTNTQPQVVLEHNVSNDDEVIGVGNGERLLHDCQFDKHVDVLKSVIEKNRQNLETGSNSNSPSELQVITIAPIDDTTGSRVSQTISFDPVPPRNNTPVSDPVYYRRLPERAESGRPPRLFPIVSVVYDPGDFSSLPHRGGPPRYPTHAMTSQPRELTYSPNDSRYYTRHDPAPPHFLDTSSVYTSPVNVRERPRYSPSHIDNFPHKERHAGATTKRYNPSPCQPLDFSSYAKHQRLMYHGNDTYGSQPGFNPNYHGDAFSPTALPGSDFAHAPRGLATWHTAEEVPGSHFGDDRAAMMQIYQRDNVEGNRDIIDHHTSRKYLEHSGVDFQDSSRRGLGNEAGNLFSGPAVRLY